MTCGIRSEHGDPLLGLLQFLFQCRDGLHALFVFLNGFLQRHAAVLHLVHQLFQRRQLILKRWLLFCCHVFLR